MPIHGGFSAWTEWSACSVSCGGGSQARTRTCTDPEPQFGGSLCAGASSESRACGTEPCVVVVDGGWSEWSAWGACDTECPAGASGFFPGQQLRQRTCTNPTPSANGVPCSGATQQNRACNTEKCVLPPLACPGSSAETVDGARVYECSNHGTCVRQPADCSSGVVGCNAWCECHDGFAGTDCNKTVAELAERQQSRAVLLGYLDSAVNDMDVTPQSLHMAMVAVSSVVGAGDELDSDGQQQVLGTYHKLVELSQQQGGDEDAATFLGAETCQSMLGALGNLLYSAVGNAVGEATDGEAQTAGAVQEAAESSHDISQLIYQLPELVLGANLEDEDTVQVSSPHVSLATRRSASSQLGSVTIGDGQSITFPAGLLDGLSLPSGDGRRLTEASTVVVQALHWNVNPHGWKPGQKEATGGVTTVQLRGTDGAIINVSATNMTHPRIIQVYTPIPSSVLPEQVKCQYWNETIGAWESDGVVTTGLFQSAGSDQQYSVCSTLHLTDFSAVFELDTLNVNVVHPVDDAGLLRLYADPNNWVTLGGIVGMAVFFFIGWLIALKAQRKDMHELEKEVRRMCECVGACGDHPTRVWVVDCRWSTSS